MSRVSIKEQLTEQLVTILKKYEGTYFRDCRTEIRADCEKFLMGLGIQKSLLPQIDIFVDSEGYVNIVMGDYPSPTPVTCN